jgi:hypothetical protein
MKKQFKLISIILLIILIYRKILYPYLLVVVTEDTHNFILIILSLLLNINNIILLEEIKANTNDNLIEYKYIKSICIELSYIYKKIDTIEINIKNKKFNKSCNDLYSL